MIVLIFTIIMALILILSRRKLGLFSLAIFAGLAVDQFWNAELTKFLTGLSLNIPAGTLSGLVGLLLILTPAFLLLAKGGKQESWLVGAISGGLATVFVAVVTISNLGAIFKLDALSQNLATFARANYGWVILAAVILAVLEILSFKIKNSGQKH